MRELGSELKNDLRFINLKSELQIEDRFIDVQRRGF